MSSDSYSDTELDQNRQTVIDDDLMGYPVVQVNGRRVCGPPHDYTGEVPPNSCEIFINRIPRDYTERDLLPLFIRFGQIYELRLMIDYNSLNRGYGYIKFTQEESALRAKEIMNHHIIGYPMKTFDIQISYNKCRLFFGNIPKELPREQIECVIQQYFPDATTIVTRNRDDNVEHHNGGFIFLDFDDHKSALKAKKACARGVLRLWERDVRVSWAYPERVADEQVYVKTLFVRNIDESLTVKDIIELLADYFPRDHINKVTRDRQLTFIDCVNRECAKDILKLLNGNDVYFLWIERVLKTNFFSVFIF